MRGREAAVQRILYGGLFPFIRRNLRGSPVYLRLEFLHLADFAVREIDDPAVAVFHVEPGLGEFPFGAVVDLLLLWLAEAEQDHLVGHAFRNVFLLDGVVDVG